MARPDVPQREAVQTSHRLYVDHHLASGQPVPLDDAQSNYLLNVLRLKEGSGVLIFNGRDGEFTARLALATRRKAGLITGEQRRAQTPAPHLSCMFAPLKHARLDYMVQKAVEMGAGQLVPVITLRTQSTRLNLERMRANAIEAAEQCGLLSLPDIIAERPLRQVLDIWPEGHLLVFCDEDAPVADPVAALQAARLHHCERIAVLIGPEGGFEPGEREALLRVPLVVRLSLGPRILRADTAAVAALALVQAVLGDLSGQLVAGMPLHAHA